MCVYHNLHRNIPPLPPPLKPKAVFPVNVLPDIIDTPPVTTSMNKAPVMYVMSTQVIQYNNNKSNNVRISFCLHSFKMCAHIYIHVYIIIIIIVIIKRYDPTAI